MMIYIDINQEKLHKINPELDFNDGAILAYLIRFSNSASIQVKVDMGKIYYWFGHEKIIKDLPLLKIKTIHGIKRRIDKLIDSGILIRHPDNEVQRKSFYGFGNKYDSYFLTENPSKNKNEPVTEITASPVTEITDTRNRNYGNSKLTYSKLVKDSKGDFEKKSQSEFSEYEDVSLNEQEKEKKKVAPKKKSPSLFDEPEVYQMEVWPSFDDFWNLYDKKSGKEKAEKTWEKIKQSDKEKIMEVLPEYVASTPEKQYRKDPTTYLNGKHWNDEIIVKHKKMDAVDQVMKNNNITHEQLAQMMRS